MQYECTDAGEMSDSAALSITDPTCPALGSNPGHRGGKPATNRLSYAMAKYYTFNTILHNFPKIIINFHSTYKTNLLISFFMYLKHALLLGHKNCGSNAENQTQQENRYKRNDVVSY
jgi:hypothetical protein